MYLFNGNCSTKINILKENIFTGYNNFPTPSLEFLTYNLLKLSAAPNLNQCWRSAKFAIADPCPYDVKYSPDVLQKKTKVIDTYNTDKNCFYNFYVE